MVYTIQHYMTVQAWCTRYNIIWPFRHGVHDTTLYDRSGMVYTIQHYMIKLVSDLRQVGGFLWFPPRYNWNIVESGVKHHKLNPNRSGMVYTIQHYMTVQAWCTRYNIIWPFRHGVHDTTLYDRSGMVYVIQHYMTVQAWCTRYNIIWPFRHGVHDTTLYDKACQWLATSRWFSLVSSTI